MNFLLPRTIFKTISKNSLLFLFYKKYSVRVRFAPSPTGYLHLGGLRTALYNHLFALSQNGTTVLRIEDTDQERKVEGAVEQLAEDLAWCGLEYDEGPILQSTRLKLYNDSVNSLIEKGAAYRCFCTSTRLDILRREAVKAGQIPKYDNRCRSLTKKEITDKLEKKIPFCVRFSLHPCSEPVNDLVYGEISQDVASIEGDPVILKTDGFPTYHLANVVDDHDMKITHVLRGVEWQGSTKKHILLYKAFGWTPPKFAHLPLLLNPDGSKLSKRQGDVHVKQYRDKGLFPLALINFAVRVGGGFDLEHAERDVTSFTIKELADKFDLRKMKGSSCKVSLDKLDLSNQLELSRRLADKQLTEDLVSKLQAILSDHFNNSEHKGNIDTSSSHVQKILQWTQNRIFYLHDLLAPSWQFLWILPGTAPLTPQEIQVLQSLVNILEKCPFEPEELKKQCKSCALQSQMKFPAFMKLLRKVLSGLKEGPSVVEIMDILGKETVLQRLRNAITAGDSKKMDKAELKT